MEGLIKLHNEDLHNVYSSQNIICVIKLRRMRWAERLAHLGCIQKLKD
jgi:hypothetical protein